MNQTPIYSRYNDVGNQLIELSRDDTFKQMFSQTSLETFWADLYTGNYAELAAKAFHLCCTKLHT